MSTATSWFIQYALVIMMGILAGPLAAMLPADAIGLSGSDGSQTLRLLFQTTSLTGLCVLAVLGRRRMPDNGGGFSFIRSLLLPLTALGALILTDKAVHTVGPPWVDHLGPTWYAAVFTTGLVLCGLWGTVAWLRHVDALSRFFSIPSPPPTGSGHMWGRDQSPVVMGKRFSGPPSTLGRYKILKEIGRGAMGVVYLGKDPTIQRLVAIKTMRLDGLDDPCQFERIKGQLFQEAKSAGRLTHPNIVTIYDAGEEDDLGFIAMELLEGATLTRWSRPPHLLPIDQLLTTLATVADALDYAHQQGIVHRDIKPSNIMLTPDQLVKVMDFGIAKMASSSRTETDLVLGTPIYMSPEQIAGKQVDGRSDIFSLGVVLFELLTGRLPFYADDVSALLFAIAHTSSTPLAHFRTDLPPTVQEVLEQALRKDPVHRYRRAQEFAQNLRACLQGSAA